MQQVLILRRKLKSELSAVLKGKYARRLVNRSKLVEKQASLNRFYVNKKKLFLKFYRDKRVLAVRSKMISLFLTVKRTKNNFFLAFYTKGGRLLSVVSAGMTGFRGDEKLSLVSGEVAGKLLVDKLLKHSAFGRIRFHLKNLIRKKKKKRKIFFSRQIAHFFRVLGRPRNNFAKVLSSWSNRENRLQNLSKVLFKRVLFFRSENAVKQKLKMSRRLKKKNKPQKKRGGLVKLPLGKSLLSKRKGKLKYYLKVKFSKKKRWSFPQYFRKVSFLRKLKLGINVKRYIRKAMISPFLMLHARESKWPKEKSIYTARLNLNRLSEEDTFNIVNSKKKRYLSLRKRRKLKKQKGLFGRSEFGFRKPEGKKRKQTKYAVLTRNVSNFKENWKKWKRAKVRRKQRLKKKVRLFLKYRERPRFFKTEKNSRRALFGFLDSSLSKLTSGNFLGLVSKRSKLKKAIFYYKTRIQPKKRKKIYKHKPFVMSFRVKRMRSLFFKLFKLRRFKKRKSVLRRDRRVLFPFKFKYRNWYTFRKARKKVIFDYYFALKKISFLFQQRIKKRRAVRNYNLYLYNKFLEQLTELKQEHSVRQHEEAEKAKQLGKFFKWSFFKKPKKFNPVRVRLPPRKPFLPKRLYRMYKKIRFFSQKKNLKFKKKKDKMVVSGPFFFFVARSKINSYVKAALKQIFRAIPFFCRFISAVRRPHNGIRPKKVRRM